MDRISRRDFIRKTAGAGLLATTGGFSRDAFASTRRAVRATDRVKLGRTGIEASFLAQGTGVHGWQRQSDHTRMGVEAAAELMRYGYERGLNFIDTADLYGTHPLAAKALSGVPREDYVLLTKIWAKDENWNSVSGGAFDEVERFRRALDTDYLDVVLVHAQTDPKWTTVHQRVLDELSELKDRGVVRGVGASCHSFGALKEAATHPWVDLIFARINHMGGSDYSMDGSAEEIADVLRMARSNGKAVVGMKIYGVGKLVEPEQMDTSLRYVIGNDLVDAMTIGMLKTEHMDDNITRIARASEAVQQHGSATSG